MLGDQFLPDFPLSGLSLVCPGGSPPRPGGSPPLLGGLPLPGTTAGGLPGTWLGLLGVPFGSDEPEFTAGAAGVDWLSFGPRASVGTGAGVAGVTAVGGGNEGTGLFTGTGVETGGAVGDGFCPPLTGVAGSCVGFGWVFGAWLYVKINS